MSKYSAESFENPLQGRKALDLSTTDCCPTWLLGRVGGCEVGLQPRAGQAQGEGWGWTWCTAVGPSARSRPAWKGTKDRHQRGYVGGRATHLGWQGQRENSLLPVAELEATGNSSGSCGNFSDAYNDDSSVISHSALGPLLSLRGATVSLLVCLGIRLHLQLCRACCTTVSALHFFISLLKEGSNVLLNCVVELQNREITLWDVKHRS